MEVNFLSKIWRSKKRLIFTIKEKLNLQPNDLKELIELISWILIENSRLDVCIEKIFFRI
jgi:hypothetical protein